MSGAPIRLLLAASALLLASCGTAPSAGQKGRLTILVSIDGFRWDYIERHGAPTLARLAAGGTRMSSLTPSFPSKTFPNHYTLVTGLRPESHGIVANWFWDPALGEMFGMAKMETHWWDAGEPVWITAEKQGVRTACFFWPGSEARIQGRQPWRFRKFEKKLTNPERVDGLLAWLAGPAAERPKFATLYFDSVDTIGHDRGPLAPETRAAVREADAAIARLLDGLANLGLRESTNLVVVSDHGMSECGPDKVIFFEDLMDTDLVQIESDGPNGGVRPKDPAQTAAILAGIRAKAPPQLKAYLREEVPAEFHYRKSDRIPPIVLMCDDHWNIERKSTWGAKRATFPKGTHGWDPRTENMGALFVAHGPDIARGKVIDRTDNIHVYNLVCALLGIRPAPNEGDDRLAHAVMAR
jgi:predicted AlkP superfamily pyrophosphatase or phosphodiesterase